VSLNPPLLPPLPRRPLGGSGISVRPIGYGAMALSAGKSAAGVPSEKEALAVIHAAIESGADLIDTADTYGLGFGEMGHNERLIGKALRAHPGHRVTVATKGGVLHGSGGWRARGGAGALRKACEESLARLGLEAIPLYQLHHLDREVPVEGNTSPSPVWPRPPVSCSLIPQEGSGCLHERSSFAVL
jgi:aryl-alcohol dehydrogenase-like predicted oxidoreductase